MARQITTGRPRIKEEDKKPYMVATRTDKRTRLKIINACEQFDMSTAEFVLDCILRRLKTLES